MDSSRHDVTEAELAVLQAIWDRGPATIRHLTDAIYPKGTDTHYATVQKLLDRLESKGFVHRDRSQWAHVFAAVVSREELLGRRLRAMLDQLCGGSLTPLLTHLVKAERLSLQEWEELRKLLGE